MNYKNALLSAIPSKIEGYEKKPKKGDIIECEDFTYLVTDYYHEYAKRVGIKKGNPIHAGGSWETEYDENDPDYAYVRACVFYKGDYYFIPSFFSSKGTMDMEGRTYKTLKTGVATLPTLDLKTCKENWPGYLY